jgi:predicted GH43/DUF377 family glycosyl hydrolase
MTPSALLIEEDVIRIWGGVRDEKGVSRITYIDVEAKNPKHILAISNKPALDIGNDGCFDDNGVILGDVIRVGSDYYMYYVGFQHVAKVKFCAFTGLAISKDGGRSFKRYSEAPILDRSDKARYIRALHTVIYDGNIFKAWYAIGNRWECIDGIPYPSYNIWYLESKDGINFSNKDTHLCIHNQNNEYRIGRPKVYKRHQKYQMFYTRDFIPKDYVIGYAESIDGKIWERRDELVGISKSSDGWDSEMACYPVLLEYNEKVYMFYNGNGMGKTGVGYAELVEE